MSQTPAAPAQQSWMSSLGLNRPLLPQILLLAVLLGLAMLGMAIASRYEEKGWRAWLGIVVLYGLISIGLAWRHAKERKLPIWKMVIQQLLHWAGLAICLKVVFVLDEMGSIDRVVVGNFTILLLALSCFYAGLHFDWLFLVVALFLIEIAYLNGLASENMWIFMIITFIVLVGGSAVALRIWRKRQAAKAASAS